ncbi:MAG TPA: Rid family hydrolase [Povalibacter sp.]
MTRYHFDLVLLVLVALFAIVAASVADEQRGPRFLNSQQGDKLGLPFSEAVRAGDFLYLSGQIGNVPGELAPVRGGVGPESRQALLNVKHVLQRHGSAVQDVIKCTVFLVDMAEWAQFNEVYREFFKAPYPTRSAVGVKELALGARVEVECLSYSPQHGASAE